MGGERGVHGLPMGRHNATASRNIGFGQPAQQLLSREREVCATSIQKDWKLLSPRRISYRAQTGDIVNLLCVSLRKFTRRCRTMSGSFGVGQVRWQLVGRSFGSCSQPPGNLRGDHLAVSVRGGHAHRVLAQPPRPICPVWRDVVIIPPSPVVMILRGWNDQAVISAPAPTGRPRYVEPAPQAASSITVIPRGSHRARISRGDRHALDQRRSRPGGRCQHSVDRLRSEVSRGRIDIGKYRLRADVGGGIGRGDEGERRHHNVVTWPNAGNDEREVEAVVHEEVATAKSAC